MNTTILSAKTLKNKMVFVENEETVMTVKEVASAMGVSYSSVDRAITKLFPDKKQNGKATFLNEYEVSLISKEIKGHHNLFDTEKVKNTTTDLEILENALTAFTALKDLYNRKEAEYQATIQQQQEEIATQKPKAIFYDNYCNSQNLSEIGLLGEKTGIGKQNIFKVLKADKVILEKWVDGIKYYEAYFAYKKYFKSIPSPFETSDGRKLNRDKLMLTQEGMIYFTKKYAA